MYICTRSDHGKCSYMIPHDTHLHSNIHSSKLYRNVATLSHSRNTSPNNKYCQDREVSKQYGPSLYCTTACLCSARNKDQLKIGYFVGYSLLSHWKCTGNLADQNGFWSTKCWSWSENGQWLTVISSTAYAYCMYVGTVITLSQILILERILCQIMRLSDHQGNFIQEKAVRIARFGRYSRWLRCHIREMDCIIKGSTYMYHSKGYQGLYLITV